MDRFDELRRDLENEIDSKTLDQASRPKEIDIENSVRLQERSSTVVDDQGNDDTSNDAKSNRKPTDVEVFAKDCIVDEETISAISSDDIDVQSTTITTTTTTTTTGAGAGDNLVSRVYSGEVVCGIGESDRSTGVGAADEVSVVNTNSTLSRHNNNNHCDKAAVEVVVDAFTKDSGGYAEAIGATNTGRGGGAEGEVEGGGVSKCRAQVKPARDTTTVVDVTRPTETKSLPSSVGVGGEVEPIKSTSIGVEEEEQPVPSQEVSKPR